MLRHVMLAAVLVLAACSGRPEQSVLQPSEASPAMQPLRLLVATTRARTAAKPPEFVDARSAATSYLSFDISIPPTHRASQIEWPRGTPDPATDFVTVGRQEYDRAGFRKAAQSQRAGTGVSLFVHGYNNSFQESVYRAAQIAHDSQSEGTSVLFAWPSAASPTGYVSDRDSADFSRDELARLMADLAQDDRQGRVLVVGHSMGGRLTMEALVQLRLAGRKDVLDRLEVILADPDIDQDLFWSQVRIVGRLPIPVSVLVATDDRALAFSQLLAGGHARIGRVDIRDPALQARAKALGVRLVDITALETDGLAHSRIDQLAALYTRLPASNPVAGLRQAGAFVLGNLGQGMTELGGVIGQ